MVIIVTVLRFPRFTFLIQIIHEKSFITIAVSKNTALLQPSGVFGKV